MSQDLQKLLYVEDDESIAEVAMMVLEDIGGFQVKHCASGQEALDTVIPFNPQLVLMDVMMPGMDGPQTFANLRALPQTASIPVVFMTAKAQLHEQQAYLGLGAAGVIVKPFDPVSLVEQVLDIWRTATQANLADTDAVH